MSVQVSLQALAQATNADVHVDDYDNQVTLDTQDGRYTIGNQLDGNGAPYFSNTADIHGGQLVYIGKYDMMGSSGWLHVSAPVSSLIGGFDKVLQQTFRNLNK